MLNQKNLSSGKKLSYGNKKKIFLLILYGFFFISILLVARCQPKEETKAMKKQRNQPYFCLWETKPEPIIAEEGEIISLKLKFSNAGRRPWKSTASPPCLLSYHLLDKNKNMIRRDNPRFELPKEIMPGESMELQVNLPAPLTPGQYFLEFDLVLEGKTWFKDYGSKTLLWPLKIKSALLPEFKQKPSLDITPYTLFETNWSEINDLGKLIRLTLHHGEVKFKGQTGEVFGFRAGTGYPQIWVRDSATILWASRYFYPEPFLSSWLEEILCYQDENGSIPDWVDASGQVDKNTTESDQEASAIQAASLLVRIMGPEKGRQWLEKKIAGQKIIDRLQKGLNYLFDHRYDQKLGLIIGTHTADWGDVEIGESDQQAIYADENSIWTADIYDQSMVYQACLDLASLFSLLGEKKYVSFWQNKAQAIKSRTNQLLWQDERGFYRLHLHVSSLNHDFEEKDLFALGGNTLAILSNLADYDKAKKIIQVALDRRQQYGLSTISGCLLPPYPASFFQHPLMDEPYEYQNGGQWDWFGGRMITAMYNCGFSQKATQCLLEIARKNINRGTFFEWDTREGAGRGSLNFVGSAGALALAIYQGLLGFEVNEEKPIISPRLGQTEAKAQIYFPLNGLFYSYEYQCDEKLFQINFAFNSNDSRQGIVKLIWPWGKSRPLRAKLDDQTVPFKLKRIGQDTYLEIETNFIGHKIEVTGR
ncbi:MAG: hypothetical protein N3B16_01160 [Candidatus Aminicenantes bacterium]|nr:hypothetical protein [Candidatus Aminicenantes bacterium]